MRRTIYGREIPHPSIAISLHNLGYALEEQGNLADAQNHYEQALRMLLQVYNEQPHPEIVTAFRSLERVLLARGNIDEAERYFTRAQAMRQQVEINGYRAAGTVAWGQY